MAKLPARQRNPTMFGGNKFKLAVFGSNCSSGRAATKVPERWQNTFAENVQLAQLAERHGIEAMVPIGRWKGFGGETNFEGSTFETITWACGLLAATKRLSVFGTVHVPIFPPVLAAKQIATADHIGAGRFGLNIVCGWNQDEFDMFGFEQDVHDNRYARGKEWLDIITRIWSEEAPFDFDGRYYRLKSVQGRPQPWGGRPPHHHERRQFAGRAAVRRAQLRHGVRPTAFPRHRRRAHRRRARLRPRSARRSRSPPRARWCAAEHSGRRTSISAISPSRTATTAPSTR